MADMPSDSELEMALREILRVVNVEEASLKIIRQKLEARFEVCFKPLHRPHFSLPKYSSIARGQRRTRIVAFLFQNEVG